MAVEVDVKAMLEAGAHFGHQTRRWNPKMRPFIYTQRDGVHIIDLGQTAEQTKRAVAFVRDSVARGGSILFVGTKKQATTVIQQEAERGGQFYVVNRWMGGTLTNFKTIKSSIDRLKNLCARRDNGELEKLTKKEGLTITRTIGKLENALGGIRDMTKTPAALFIVDPEEEKIACNEAFRLGIPVIAIIDTNGNPEGIDYPIVANDDALRSIQYFTALIANACAEGLVQREHVMREESERRAKEGAEKESGVSGVKERRVGGKGRAYTAQKPTDRGADLPENELEAFSRARVEEKDEVDP